MDAVVPTREGTCTVAVLLRGNTGGDGLLVKISKIQSPEEMMIALVLAATRPDAAHILISDSHQAC